MEKKYKKNFEYSYSFGMFPTIELINSKKEKVIKVLVSSNLYKDDNSFDIFKFCEENNIKIEINDKAVNRIADKENCFVIGVFEKYDCEIEKDNSHIVLVNPSNMGNMGTIIRTLTGFGLNNLVIISPGVDIFDPKVIRASMGSLFKINYKYYNSFEEYIVNFQNHKIYTFMLDGAISLKEVNHEKNQLFCLVFGNEGSGLDEEFAKIGTNVIIKHTNRIDSLNLPIAASIAMYEFCS